MRDRLRWHWQIRKETGWRVKKDLRFTIHNRHLIPSCNFLKDFNGIEISQPLYSQKYDNATRESTNGRFAYCSNYGPFDFKIELLLNSPPPRKGIVASGWIRGCQAAN